MRLLIVGTLDGHIVTAGRIALQRGAKVAHVPTVEAALHALRSGQGADLVFADIALEVGELIAQLELERIVLPVIACGIGNDTERAVQAIRAGAKEYLPLPPDPELIAAVLAAVVEETNAFITRDAAMLEILKLADQIAPSNASVLITGESGTGKEVMARFIHSRSKRGKKPFVSVNCAAIPDNLLESELFGHEKGAFTGAVARRVGKFEEAHGGTLLLDEISEMEPRLQAKLLRVIQEREIDRVGGTQPIKVDIRLLATSNRDLEEEVRHSRFREDLYYRLNVVNIALLPLRQRRKDIELLSGHFIAKYAEANGVRCPELSPEALALLQSHHWRGNVRELENAMHRAILMSQDQVLGESAITLTGERLSADGQAASSETPAIRSSAAPVKDGEGEARHLVGRTVADVERDLILDTLHHCLGNRTHAANILGISIRTLRNKLRLYSQEGTPVPAPGQSHGAAA